MTKTAVGIPEQWRRSEAIRIAMRTLAAAGPTATGATLILPDGSSIYVSVDDARAFCAANATGRGA